jgi:hypothetical protein
MRHPKRTLVCEGWHTSATLCPGFLPPGGHHKCAFLRRSLVREAGQEDEKDDVVTVGGAHYRNAVLGVSTSRCLSTHQR